MLWQHDAGTTPSPHPKLLAVLFDPESKVLNLVVLAITSVSSYLRANKFQCHHTAVRMVYRGLEQYENAVDNRNVTSREPNLNFVFLVNKDIQSGCNIKVLLPHMVPLRDCKGIHRVNMGSPFNLPEHIVHHDDNIPEGVDFL